MRLPWRLLVSLAIIGPLLAIGFYIYVFVPISSPSFSKNPEDWARFGEYLGGTVGAFYGFLAFVGVLVSLRIQLNQARVDELQRLMATVSQTIDSIFAMEPRHLQKEAKDRIKSGSADPMTVFSILAAIGVKAFEVAGKEATEDDKKMLMFGTNSIRHECGLIVIELQQLVLLLETYHTYSENDVISNFYETRYGVIVSWLRSVELISSSIVDKYFATTRS